jgi:hypothetical protein
LRHRLVLAALVPVVVALGGLGTAHAAPSSGTVANHGQCVRESPQSHGAGGRSATAKSKGSCTLPLSCVENNDVQLDSARNTVTVSGSPDTDGSSLECAANIAVRAGDTVSFTYELGDDTDDCGGGVARMFVVIGGKYYNTIDGDPECDNATGNTITYEIPVTGTVTQIGFVYDRADEGSATYSNAKIGGVTLNI